MMTLQIVAVAFVGALVLFFMAVIWFGKTLDANAFAIVRFLSAVCAGFAGGLFLGSITLNVNTAGRLTVSAAGGAACFVLVWLTFGTKALQGEWYNFSVPEDCTLDQAATAMVQGYGGQIAFDPSVTEKERKTLLRTGVVKARNLKSALEKLPLIATTSVSPIQAILTPPADYTLRA